MTEYTTKDIPFGYCHCGCGELAPLIKPNCHTAVARVGTPRKFIPGHSTRLRPIRDPVVNFWNNVNKNGSVPAHCPELGQCWEWTGTYLLSGGYGTFHANGVRVRAHRFSWEQSNGNIKDGLWVLHKCDNPKCVRPSHLFLGNPLDNSQDMVNKNRSARGEKGGRHKLTNLQAEYIRIRYAVGDISQSQLGREMGIDQAQISRIVNRKAF